MAGLGGGLKGAGEGVTHFHLFLDVSGSPVCYKIRKTNPFHINGAWGDFQ